MSSNLQRQANSVKRGGRLNEALDRQGFMDRITDGSLTINSVEEYESLLKKFPGDRFLIKAFADFLADGGAPDQAAPYYRKAAELFAAVGMVLFALASKVGEWRTSGSSRRECRNLYAAIQEVRSDTPLNDFFCHMAYPEFLAVIMRLESIRFPAGAVVINSGDPEAFLHFVVSGTVAETVNPSAGEGGGIRREFSANSEEMNYFGDVYPFDEQKQASSLIETVQNSELLKISKIQLMDLCEEHPNVEILLMRLTKAHRLSTEKGVSQKDRRAVRYQLQTQVDMKIFKNEPHQSQLILKGLIQDISLGGACVTLGEKYLTGPPAEIIGKSVKVQVNVPKVEVGLNLFGTIAWCREVLREGKTIVIAGIQFKDMTHSDLAFLRKHCYVGEEAQDLISYLWESLAKG
jgi:CRP-like cAMP-binding protein